MMAAARRAVCDLVSWVSAHYLESTYTLLVDNDQDILSRRPLAEVQSEIRVDRTPKEVRDIENGRQKKYTKGGEEGSRHSPDYAAPPISLSPHGFVRRQAAVDAETRLATYTYGAWDSSDTTATETNSGKQTASDSITVESSHKQGKETPIEKAGNSRGVGKARRGGRSGASIGHTKTEGSSHSIGSRQTIFLNTNFCFTAQHRDLLNDERQQYANGLPPDRRMSELAEKIGCTKIQVTVFTDLKSRSA
jgi:hypothetical protein